MVLERNFLRADTGIFQQNEVPMKKIPLKRIFAAAALVCCLTDPPKHYYPFYMIDPAYTAGKSYSSHKMQKRGAIIEYCFI